MQKRHYIEKAIGYCGGVSSLAKKVGCSTETVYRWLNRTRNYSPGNAEALSSAVDGTLTPEDFMADLLKFPRTPRDLT